MSRKSRLRQADNAENYTEKSRYWNAGELKGICQVWLPSQLFQHVWAIVSSTALLVRLIAERRKFFFGLREQSRTITGLLHFFADHSGGRVNPTRSIRRFAIAFVLSWSCPAWRS